MNANVLKEPYQKNVQNLFFNSFPLHFLMKSEQKRLQKRAHTEKGKKAVTRKRRTHTDKDRHGLELELLS